MYTLSLTLGDIMVIVWFAIIIFAAAIEALSMDLTSIWFSGGALLALIIAAVFGDRPGSMIAQIVVFIVTSGAMLIVLRPILQRHLKKNDVRTNADSLVGKTAIVLKRITPDDRGEVRIEGKIWSAVANETLEPEAKVEVLAISGVKLVVRKLQ